MTASGLPQPLLRRRPFTRMLAVAAPLAMSLLGGTTEAAPRSESSSPAIGTLPRRTPEQIALLRWYPAIQTGATFTAGESPFDLAFDGVNLWVSNFVAGSVSKIRASDGTIVGTFSVGYHPSGIAFDGQNIWVGDGPASNLYQVRASDGAVIGTFPMGPGTSAVPSFWGVAFDGANVWVATTVNVTKLRVNDGVILGTYPVGRYPCGIAFDGANIWVVTRF